MNQHLSKSYDTALQTVLYRFLQMGDLASTQVKYAVNALKTQDEILARTVITGDNAINDFERTIDELLVALIAQRQPTASDLRFIVAISKAVVDLERIGDEAVKIARAVLHDCPSEFLKDDASAIAKLLDDNAKNALNALEHKDSRLALQVIEKDKEIDKLYKDGLANLKLLSEIDNPNPELAIGVLRSLERIGDHIKNIGEHTIYWVVGVDIRHLGFEKSREVVEQSYA